MQPAEGTTAQIPIILDIEAFVYGPVELDEPSLKKRLAVMQWLKNKVFFSSITDKAKESFPVNAGDVVSARSVREAVYVAQQQP